MKIKAIQVLGSGCPTCKQLLETTKKVVKELNIRVEVEYITDVSKIVEAGIMASPALTINGRPVLIGRGINEKDVKNVLQNNMKKNIAGCAGDSNC